MKNKVKFGKRKRREIRPINPFTEYDVRKKFQQYTTRAKKKNIDFKLSYENFIFLCNQECFYCGHFEQDKIVGVDRVNNNQGYIVGNVAPCCWTCNKAKGDMSHFEFFKYRMRFTKNV